MGIPQNKEKKITRETCTQFCNTKVATNSVDRIVVDGVVYHRRCYERLPAQLKALEALQEKEQKKVVSTTPPVTVEILAPEWVVSGIPMSNRRGVLQFHPRPQGARGLLMKNQM